MSRKIRGIETPSVAEHQEIETPRVKKASISQNPVYREVHAESELRGINEEKVEQTRNAIIEKYGIPADNCIIISPESGQTARKIRAFNILLNKEDPGQSWYAEGHMSHALLLEKIFENQNEGGDRIKIALNPILEKNFFDKWDVLKGFVDPNQNGFKSFPFAEHELRNESVQQMNGLKEDDMEAKNIPNWFLSADTRKK